MTDIKNGTSLPIQIGKPALRALNGHGIFNLEELSTKSLQEVRAYHGIGPKALRILEEALKVNGLSFLTD